MSLISRINKNIKRRAFQRELKELASKPFNAENMKELYRNPKYKDILLPIFVTKVQEGSEDYLRSLYDKLNEETSPH